MLPVILSLFACNPKTGVKISLEIDEQTSVDVVACANLSELGYTPDSGFTLYDGEMNPVPFQSKENMLYWVVSAPVAAGTHLYTLDRENTAAVGTSMQTEKENGLLTVKAEGKDLLGYQFETRYPPEGVDSAYQRSGFIHPLKTPQRKILTRIQPPDHYHHYGIWNPWTHTLFEGDTLDFWNLLKRQGTVKFAGFKSITEGTVFSEYQTHHQHVVLKKDETTVALNELQTVRVYRPGSDYYLIDLQFDYSCAADSPFKILEYRYGGLGWRTTAEWDQTNSEVLTSEGKSREDADGSLARWLLVQGTLGDAYGGALIMSDPANYNHPEPLRVWPIPEKGRGELMVCFSPTKNTDWTMEPGKQYTLKYRMIVFDGRWNQKKAEEAWHYYQSPARGVASTSFF